MSDIEIHHHKGCCGHLDHPDARDKADPLAQAECPCLPPSVDLREWCPAVKDQGKMNACTAHAGTTLVEYYQKRAFPDLLYVPLSRMFLYKVTRNLLAADDPIWNRDRGANARTTMKALSLFGVPAEAYWPYEETRVFEEPPAFCYVVAGHNRAKEYYRLDTDGVSRAEVLKQIKFNLASHRMLMLSVLLYNECLIKAAQTGGNIPLPRDLDQPSGKPIIHTLVAIGYDDDHRIESLSPPFSTTGAIRVMNSWGQAWGDEGYGWIPYDYVTAEGAARSGGRSHVSFDFWTLVKQEWLETGQFNPRI